MILLNIIYHKAVILARAAQNLVKINVKYGKIRID